MAPIGRASIRGFLVQTRREIDLLIRPQLAD